MAYLSLVAVAVLTLCTPSWAQVPWQGGQPVPNAETIRISVGNAADNPPTNRAQQDPVGDPFFTGQFQAAPGTGNQLPQAGNQVSQTGNQPGGSHNIFSQFSPFMFDTDMMYDRICGMSRRAFSSGGMNPMFWQFNLYTCSCRMFEGDPLEMHEIDPSPQASRDCMTAFTRLVCCRT